MKTTANNQTQLPMIVKYVGSLYNGIQPLVLSRHAIGYILRGSIYIHDGDKRQVLTAGDAFYLGVGNHYIETSPENGHPFEYILFFYTSAELQRILLHLNIVYGLSITNKHSCDACCNSNFVRSTACGMMRNFFTNVDSYLRDDDFRHDPIAENIKMTELVYLITSNEDCCLKSKLISNVDAVKENFDRIIHEHIFIDIPIEELAVKTARSLTSFKKEFGRLYQLPPHKWFTDQRLTHARLLLISTSKAISEIGNECAFPNTSHFIKLFKKKYNTTPAMYRNRNRDITCRHPRLQPIVRERIPMRKAH